MFSFSPTCHASRMLQSLDALPSASHKQALFQFKRHAALSPCINSGLWQVHTGQMSGYIWQFRKRCPTASVGRACCKTSSRTTPDLLVESTDGSVLAGSYPPVRTQQLSGGDRCTYSAGLNGKKTIVYTRLRGKDAKLWLPGKAGVGINRGTMCLP